MELPIKTSRLTLRLPEARDAEAIARHAGERDIAQWLGTMPHPYPVEVAEGWIVFAQWQARRALHYPLALDHPREGLIGFCGVFRHGNLTKGAQQDWELGYWVAKPYWGRGYASEAAAAVIAWARGALGVRRLTAGYLEDNAASARVLEKAGFRDTGERVAVYSAARGAHVTSARLVLDLDVPGLAAEPAEATA